jgi:hypothetical protein
MDACAAFCSSDRGSRVAIAWRAASSSVSGMVADFYTQFTGLNTAFVVVVASCISGLGEP